jgi:hypothetical protein
MPLEVIRTLPPSSSTRPSERRAPSSSFSLDSSRRRRRAISSSCRKWGCFSLRSLSSSLLLFSTSSF